MGRNGERKDGKKWGNTEVSKGDPTYSDAVSPVLADLRASRFTSINGEVISKSLGCSQTRKEIVNGNELCKHDASISYFISVVLKLMEHFMKSGSLSLQ